jgi:tripartite-type tricarboxylate transporter receptor subunit TctC
MSTLTRLMGQWLSEKLGVSFFVEDRGGAGGNLGGEAVVRSAPDGYTLLLCGSPDAINATLYDKLSFVFLRDTTPVAVISRGPQVLVVHPSFPARTIPEFIACTKVNPGKVDFASAGVAALQTAKIKAFIPAGRSDRASIYAESLPPGLILVE